VVTVALVCVLFDGGMQIGWSRFRSAAVPVTVTGVAGTFGTVAGCALLAHAAFGLSWYASVLLATAVAPTDPAVVFSVLGQREVSGRGDTILKGESGANHPVGIALMAGLVGAGGLSAGALGHVGGEFLLQMGVGAAGGRGRRGRAAVVHAAGPAARRGPVPAADPGLRAAAVRVATLAHGSGFLAVFAAGIVLGDGRAPYKREIERAFVLFAGLKGAVPILLGTFLLSAGVLGARRLYGIVAVAVVFSVVVQGSLVPAAARLLRVPMRPVEPEPWALGVRLRDEPSGVHQLTVTAGSPADGRTIDELAGLPGGAWVSFIVRDGQLVPIKGGTRLRPGDDVLVLADPGLHDKLTRAFAGLSA
jgi:cell volume regulation protein A